MVEKIVTRVIYEDGTVISARMTVFKTSGTRGHLKDGRPVWYDNEKKCWYIPEKVSKGER